MPHNRDILAKVYRDYGFTARDLLGERGEAVVAVDLGKNVSVVGHAQSPLLGNPFDSID
jgi:hypothetical protein